MAREVTGLCGMRNELIPAACGSVPTLLPQDRTCCGRGGSVSMQGGDRAVPVPPQLGWAVPHPGIWAPGVLCVPGITSPSSWEGNDFSHPFP